MKGIILPGGGFAVVPIHIRGEQAVAAVYDKPMVYYPLTTLIEGGICETVRRGLGKNGSVETLIIRSAWECGGLTPLFSPGRLVARLGLLSRRTFPDPLAWISVH